MAYYYRKPIKDNYENDIENLNNKIDIIYTSLENIINERNDLLVLFNSRINDNIPNENIFHEDIKVDDDNRYKLTFTCKSEPSDIYKYVFHIFIKSDLNIINLKFIVNDKHFTYDVYVDKLKYLKIEEKFIFNKVENFKIYLKTDKPLTIMKYSSYEVLINYHEATILDIPLKKNSYIIFEYIFNSEYIDIPLVTNLKIDDISEKDFNINLKEYNKIRHMFKLDYNVTKINFYLYLLNNEIYNDDKMEYLKKILFNNKKIKFNISSYNI